jgi:hypothetical protein
VRFAARCFAACVSCWFRAGMRARRFLLTRCTMCLPVVSLWHLILWKQTTLYTPLLWHHRHDFRACLVPCHTLPRCVGAGHKPVAGDSVATTRHKLQLGQQETTNISGAIQTPARAHHGGHRCGVASWGVEANKRLVFNTNLNNWIHDSWACSQGNWITRE